MMKVFMLFLISICTFLFLMSIFFMESNSLESSEMSYECGFEPLFMNRVPFSLHYFSIMIVFLIFDMEIMILIPVLFYMLDFYFSMVYSLLFIVLLLGVLVEWYDSSLEWTL